MSSSLYCAHTSIAARLLTAALLLAGCRSEGTPPLYTEPGDPQAPTSGGPGEVDPEQATPAADSRNLWFASGLGRDAILARERDDHPAAVQALDTLLARTDLPANDRAAASWLRGLEAVAADDHAAAAKYFADARKSPELAPVEDRLRVLEARALLATNEPAEALACVASVKSTGAHAPDLLMLRASGHQRTRAPDVAKELYLEFIKTYGSHARRHEARIKLARLLANESTDESRRQMYGLYLQLAEEVPRSDYGQEAIAELPDLAKALGKTLPSEARSSRSGTRLEDIRRDLKRGHYNKVISQVNSLLSQTKRPSNSDRCEALYLKGSAIFKQRKRAKSRPVFELAARACKQAGTKSVDTLVKSRYQAGRGRYAEGLYTRAGKAFESLARDHKDHTYADDAWVLAGESWASAGNLERERKAYEQSLIHHPRGDKAGEARRRLILQAFSQKRYEDILSLTSEGQKGGNLKLRERAKLHYFAGRAYLA
ncbi:MAG: tetratricopeptide repeat protein, partial [Nannocystaceae bacterium]